ILRFIANRYEANHSLFLGLRYHFLTTSVAVTAGWFWIDRKMGEGMLVSPYPFNVLNLYCINLSVAARKGDDCVLIAMFGEVELGVIYAIMALGVYLTFRVLDFADLQVDGCFVT